LLAVSFPLHAFWETPATQAKLKAKRGPFAYKIIIIIIIITIITIIIIIIIIIITKTKLTDESVEFS